MGLVLSLGLFVTASFSFVEGNWVFMKAEGAERIALKEARERVLHGQAMLVCVYSSDETFNKMRLQGAIPLSEFEKKLGAGARGCYGCLVSIRL
jgi:hypothetical protein